MGWASSTSIELSIDMRNGRAQRQERSISRLQSLISAGFGDRN